MSLSWPNKAAGKAARRSAARGWMVGATVVATVGAVAMVAPAMSAMAATHTAKTATTTTMSAVSGYVGTKLTLSAKVKGGTLPKGTVKFVWGHTTLCSAALSNGTAKCAHAFGGAGSLKVEAEYLGNATHKASQGLATVTVKRLPSSVKVSASPAATGTGTAVKLTAVVSPTAATGTVTFSVGATKLGSATVSGGKASLSHAWSAAGSYAVTATYSGDAKDTPSHATTTVTVAAADGTTTAITITVQGDPYSPNLNWEPAGTVEVPFTVTNNAPGGPAPTGTVTITDPVVPVFQPKPPPPPAFTGCHATLTPGAHGISTGECAVTTEGWGFVLMQATYTPSSTTFAGSFTPITATYKIINLMNTATSVAPATATANEQVMLVGSVVPAAPAVPPLDFLKAFSEQIENGPPGDKGDTMTILVNGVAACTGTIVWNATAQADQVDCPVTLAAGHYTVEADYSGDEYTAASTGTETLTVG
jgi:VCBS repeat-containing protein